MLETNFLSSYTDKQTAIYKLEFNSVVLMPRIQYMNHAHQEILSFSRGRFITQTQRGSQYEIHT